MDIRSFGPLYCAPSAVDADGVCASQSPGAGAILINGAFASGGVATFAEAALVRLTSGGADSGITFTFNGTAADGQTQSETVAGTAASNSDTTKYFKTITSITKSGATAGTIIVGNLIGSVSRSVKPNLNITPVAIGIGVDLVSGTSTYIVQHTYEDPNNGTYPTVWFDNSAGSKSADSEATYSVPVAAVRLKVTASSSGILNGKIIQAG